jgi:hypothetical protein
MKRFIQFINRTKESLYRAFIALRSRYKHVQFVRVLHKGLYKGYFTVS